jgi:phage terminase small subunit
VKRKELTQKQERFALAYIETGNASEAYRRAYDASRMKPETINKRASELLADGAVTGRIGELRQAASDKAVVSEARVIEELARIGLFDPGQLFAEDGSLLPVKKMAPEVRAAIASVEVEELFDGAGKGRKRIGYIRKVKLWDKNSAADKLLRHLGSYEKDNRQRLGALADLSRETLRSLIERLEALRDGNRMRDRD